MERGMTYIFWPTNPSRIRRSAIEGLLMQTDHLMKPIVNSQYSMIFPIARITPARVQDE
jgi:hypothetical protein